MITAPAFLHAIIIMFETRYLRTAGHPGVDYQVFPGQDAGVAAPVYVCSLTGDMRWPNVEDTLPSFKFVPFGLPFCFDSTFEHLEVPRFVGCAPRRYYTTPWRQREQVPNVTLPMTMHFSRRATVPRGRVKYATRPCKTEMEIKWRHLFFTKIIEENDVALEWFIVAHI